MAEKFYMIPHSLFVRQDLRPSDKMVYAAIVDRIGGNGVAWPGTRRIANDVGLSRNAVKRSLAKLDAAGLLVVEPGRGGQTNQYRLGLPAGQAGGSISDPAGGSGADPAGPDRARVQNGPHGGSEASPKRNPGTEKKKKKQAVAPEATVEVVHEAQHASQVKRLATTLSTGLKLDPSNRKQFDLDCKALYGVAQRVVVGRLGDPVTIEQRAVATAQQLGADPKIKTPIAAFRAWVNNDCPPMCRRRLRA